MMEQLSCLKMGWVVAVAEDDDDDEEDEPKPNEILEGICCFWGNTRTDDRVFLEVRNSE